MLFARMGRPPDRVCGFAPREDFDERVSMDPLPPPRSEAVAGGEVDWCAPGECGSGGMVSISAGAASRPFLVVVDEDGPKRRLALGADATRRMNLEAAEVGCLLLGELLVE